MRATGSASKGRHRNRLWSFSRLSYSRHMLPMLRIIPVGGVLLAIMILVLALSPPGGLHSGLSPAAIAARGALMARGEHPEWRQFLILAATRRADELSRLRDLPGMPSRNDSAQDAARFAGLPAARSDADPDDETGSIADVPAMPMEIGETSSTELPVNAPEEKPPVIKSPERVRAPKDSRTRAKRPVHYTKLRGKPEPAGSFNLLEAIFGRQQTRQPADGSAQTSQPTAAIRN